MLPSRGGTDCMTIASQALEEFANFITSQPSLEEFVTYHTSPELTKQVYALVDAGKADTLTSEERNALNHYETIEHILMCAKAEALRKLQCQLSY
jgi:hypothetical protein